MCECGETVTSQFEMFNDELNLCKWYVFPTEMQKMLIIAMANAQQPTILRGFGNTLCIRESFKKVCSVSKRISNQTNFPEL